MHIKIQFQKYANQIHSLAISLMQKLYFFSIMEPAFLHVISALYFCFEYLHSMKIWLFYSDLWRSDSSMSPLNSDSLDRNIHPHTCTLLCLVLISLCSKLLIHSQPHYNAFLKIFSAVKIFTAVDWFLRFGYHTSLITHSQPVRLLPCSIQFSSQFTLIWIQHEVTRIQ